MKRCAQNKRNANPNTPRQDFSPIRLAKLLKFAITMLVKLWRNKFSHSADGRVNWYNPMTCNSAVVIKFTNAQYF